MRFRDLNSPPPPPPLTRRRWFARVDPHYPYPQQFSRQEHRSRLARQRLSNLPENLPDKIEPYRRRLRPCRQVCHCQVCWEFCESVGVTVPRCHLPFAHPGLPIQSICQRCVLGRVREHISQVSADFSNNNFHHSSWGTFDESRGQENPGVSVST